MSEIITPPIGWIVQFFPGDRKEAASPRAAIVTRIGTGGQVMLSLFPDGGGEMQNCGRFVRHASDPWVQSHGELLRQPRQGAPQGIWDYIPGAPKPELWIDEEIKPPTEEQAAANTEQKTPQTDAEKKAAGRKKARQLFEEGKSVDEVHRAVRFYKMTRAEVEAMEPQTVG